MTVYRIVTDLSYAQIMERYAPVAEHYCPFLLLSKAAGEVIADFKRNEDKFSKRMQKDDNYGATGIAALGKEQHGVPEHPESFYLGDTKVLQTKDGFMCQFPDADNYVPLRTDIRGIKAGDAFMLSSERPGRQGQILIAARDSHQNFDELDEPWIVYDTSENGWFEEDICTDPYTFYTHSNTMRQTPEQSVEKSSLSNQIRQAEARTTTSNAEKKTHNIEQDR